ncbi:MAG: hypothetical protein KIS92_26345 [Planctomycetota bacterium]|nr:hypothetical protein [Planctomycetota bacterium]
MKAAAKVVFLLGAVLGLTLAVRAEEKKKEEHPYKQAKVGDWIEYKITDVKSGRSFESRFKLTVKEKYENEIVFKRNEHYDGRDMPEGEEHIELNKPYRQDGDGESFQYEITATKDDKVTVGGKEYACKLVEMKITTSGIDTEEITRKVWISKDVPLDGIVKSVTKHGQNTKTRELLGCGRGAGK